MKNLAIGLSILLCCSAATAQSLAEIADQEKERRKSNAESGKEVVIELDGGPLTAKERRAKDDSARREKRSEPGKAILEEISELNKRIEELGTEILGANARCNRDRTRGGTLRPSDGFASCRSEDKLRQERRELQQAIKDLKKERDNLPRS